MNQPTIDIIQNGAILALFGTLTASHFMLWHALRKDATHRDRIRFVKREKRVAAQTEATKRKEDLDKAFRGTRSTRAHISQSRGRVR